MKWLAALLLTCSWASAQSYQIQISTAPDAQGVYMNWWRTGEWMNSALATPLEPNTSSSFFQDTSWMTVPAESLNLYVYNLQGLDAQMTIGFQSTVPAFSGAGGNVSGWHYTTNDLNVLITPQSGIQPAPEPSGIMWLSALLFCRRLRQKI